MRLIGRIIRGGSSLVCLLSLVLCLATAVFWYRSYRVVDVLRYGHARAGYYDVTFNRGQVMLTGIRPPRPSPRPVSEVTLVMEEPRPEVAVMPPQWVTRPVPKRAYLTPNPVLVWDSEVQERQLPLGMTFLKGRAQPRSSAAIPIEQELLPAPQTVRALILPAWLVVAALATLPLLHLVLFRIGRSKQKQPDNDEVDLAGTTPAPARDGALD